MMDPMMMDDPQQPAPADEGLWARVVAKLQELNKAYNPLAMVGEAMDPKAPDAAKRAAEREALIKALSGPQKPKAPPKKPAPYGVPLTPEQKRLLGEK